MSADDLEGDDIWGDSGGAEAANAAGGTAEESKTAEDDAPMDDLEDDETRHMSISELRQRIHLINNDVRVMRSDVQRITHESRGQRDRIRENQEKVKVNKQLPYLVANVVEVLEPDAEDGTFVYSVSKWLVERLSVLSLRSLLGNASMTAFLFMSYFRVDLYLTFVTPSLVTIQASWRKTETPLPTRNLRARRGQLSCVPVHVKQSFCPSLVW